MKDAGAGGLAPMYVLSNVPSSLFIANEYVKSLWTGPGAEPSGYRRI